MHELDIPKKFSDISRNFYSRLTYESLNYFLSQATRSALGEGQPFATMNQVAQLEEVLVNLRRAGNVWKMPARFFEICVEFLQLPFAKPDLVVHRTVVKD